MKSYLLHVPLLSVSFLLCLSVCFWCWIAPGHLIVIESLIDKYVIFMIKINEWVLSCVIVVCINSVNYELVEKCGPELIFVASILVRTDSQRLELLRHEAQPTLAFALEKVRTKINFCVHT